MGRGDSLARQLSLIQLLEERREVAVGEAARELGYTQRTIYRDLAVLERVGVPLYQDNRGRRARWRIVEGYRHRLSLSLSFAEMLALTAGRELLAGLSGTVFHEAAISALEKVRAAIPAEISRRATAAAKRLSASAGAAHDHRRAREVVERILVALERRESVELTYRKPGSRRATRRIVDPYHLHVQAGTLYLIGYCHSRRQVRTFLVDRAAAVRSTGQIFQPVASFSPGEIVQGTFGPWSGRKERVRLRFAPEAAAFVAERQLHPSQQLQWRSDGELDLEMELPVGAPLIAWILSWGAKVSVRGPKGLVDQVREERRRAAKVA